jgi:hypothetical protein
MLPRFPSLIDYTWSMPSLFNSDLLAVESFIAEINRPGAHDLELRTRLELPIPFCFEAGLIQAIVTWGRRAQGTRVVRLVDVDSTSAGFEEALRDIVASPHVVTAWLFANEIRDAQDKLIDKRALHVFSEHLDSMDRFEFLETQPSSAERVNLLCVQGSRREFILPFYTRPELGSKLKSPQEIRLVTQDILVQLLPRLSAGQAGRAATQITPLIFELLENTHLWARADTNNKAYKTGVRALVIRVIADLHKNAISTFAAGNSHLHAYLQQQILSNSKTELRSFVEISVLDSGPGLARRWISTRPRTDSRRQQIFDLSIGEEEDATVECFRKWASSTHRTERGIGLFAVGSYLKQVDGFMRIRTGRKSFLFGTKSAFKDIQARMSQDDVPKDAAYFKLDDGTHLFLDKGEVRFFLRTWDATTQFGDAEGTSFCLLVPLEA